MGVLSGGKTALAGSIPPELGDILSLTRISFSFDQLSGDIPVELGKLANLTGLYLQNNQLTGPIPSEFTGLSNFVSYTSIIMICRARFQQDFIR